MTNGQTKRGSGSGKANGLAYGVVKAPWRGLKGRTLSQQKAVSGGIFSGLRVHFPEGHTNHHQVHSLN